MEIGQIHEQQWPQEEWYTNEEQQWQENIDALSKGKAKGKGKNKGKGKGPICWTCGEAGHTCWTCTKNPLNSEDSKGWNNKGKGWSKGMDTHDEGKGWTYKGKGWNKGAPKGKGKGTNEVDYEQEYWNQMTEQQEETNGLGGGAINLITEDWPVISTTTNKFTKRKTTNGHGPEKVNTSSTAAPPRSTSSSMPRILNTSSGHRPEKKVKMGWAPIGCRDVDFLSRDDDNKINSLEASQGCWERIAIKIDSGAVDSDATRHCTILPGQRN